jgi:hypothetical protein
MINDRFPTFLYPVPSVEAPREMRAIIIRAKLCHKIFKKKSFASKSISRPPRPSPSDMLELFFVSWEWKQFREKNWESKKISHTGNSSMSWDSIVAQIFRKKKKVKMLKLINQVSFAFFLGSIDWNQIWNVVKVERKCVKQNSVIDAS